MSVRAATGEDYCKARGAVAAHCGERETTPWHIMMANREVAENVVGIGQDFTLAMDAAHRKFLEHRMRRPRAPDDWPEHYRLLYADCEAINRLVQVCERIPEDYPDRNFRTAVNRSLAVVKEYIDEAFPEHYRGQGPGR